MKSFIIYIFLLFPLITLAQNEDKRIYTTVDIQPEYPGGIKEMYGFIGQNIHCPESIRKANISGKILVSFVIEKDGHLDNIKILKGFWKDADEEAIRVIKLMPKWKAGVNKGKVVRVAYTLPIVDMCWIDD